MRKDNRKMLQGPLLRNVILYTIPIILTSWLQLLFNAADLVVVDNLTAVTPWLPWAPPAPLQT